MRSLNRVFLTMALFAVSVPAFAFPNLITNGGFETGSFSGWTTPALAPAPGGVNFYLVEAADTPNGSRPTGTENGYYVYAGTYAAQFGTTSPSTLSQTFSATAGTNYTLSFWLNGDPGGATSFFDTTIDGQTLNLNDPPFGWTEYSILFTGLASNSLTFTFEDASGDFMSLDDVGVSPAIAHNPEPPTWMLLGTGICGLLLLLGWRKRSGSRHAFNV